MALNADDRVQEIKEHSPILIGHLDNFELMRRLRLGEKWPMKDRIIPRMQKAGVDYAIIALGGDGAHQRGGSERPLWGSLQVMGAFSEQLCGVDSVEIVTQACDVADWTKDGKVRFIIELEGGSPLEGSIYNLSHFYGLGVRYMQMTHNERNELGDGYFDDVTGGRLSRFGMQVVREMNRLGMVIGVSHLNESGFWHVLELSETPVLATHSNARSVFDLPRNLSDRQLKALAEKGGVVGIHACQFMVCEKPMTFVKYLEHLDYVVELIGPRHVGIGLLSPDVDWRQAFEKAEVGAGYLDSSQVLNTSEHPDGLTMEQQYVMLISALMERGYSDEDISWILGRSFLRVFEQVLGGK